jgi:stage IV sporulation protein FB
LLLVFIISRQDLELFGVAGLFVSALTILIALLVHEFGHVGAAKMNGHRSYVVLAGMGAYTAPDGTSEGWRGVWLSVAGPLAGFALWAICWFGFAPEGVREAGLLFDLESMFRPLYALRTSEGLYSASQVTGGHLLWANLCWFNLVWGIFNLMPIVPLDGGHIVEHVLRMKLRAREAIRYASIASLVACAGVLVLAWKISGGRLPVFTLFVVGILAYQNFERLRAT